MWVNYHERPSPPSSDSVGNPEGIRPPFLSIPTRKKN